MSGIRIVCLLAIGVTLAGLGTLSAPGAAIAPPSPSSAAPVALIDLGSIFGGDENEPDENDNEPDEGSSTHHQPAAGQVDRRSSVSLPVVLLVAVSGLIVVGFVANRLRRLWLRLRRWVGGLSRVRP